MVRTAAWLLLLGLAACGDGSPMPGDGGADGGDGGDDTLYLTRLETSDDYARMQGEGAEVKYLNRVDGSSPPAPLDNDCQFQNTRLHEYHIQFIHEFPELAHIDFPTYVQMTLSPARVWWGGGLKVWSGVVHPVTGRRGIITYVMYTEGENLTVDQIVENDQRLKGCAPFAESLLVFVPDGPEQIAHVRTIRDMLMARGVAVLFPEDLVGDIEHEAYSVGEGYGYLNIVPRGRPLMSYGPRDVVIADSVPDTLAVVAGLVTALPQSIHSHVNLRLREKEIPNAFARDIYDNAFVLALDRRLVHIVVSEEALTIEPARIEDAQAFWDSRRPDVGPVRSDLTATELKSFADLDRMEDADAYGAKAANLGEIYDALSAPNRQDGFGIPLRMYADYVDHNNLDALIDAVLADARIRTDSAYRDQRLDDIRDAFRDGVLQPGLLDAIATRLVEIHGAGVETVRMRFRSSTNAEDLEEFSGAGLYRSASGCLADDRDGDTLGPSHCLGAEEETFLRSELARREAELRDHPDRYWLPDIIAELNEDLTEEKPIEVALKKVWGSLWNLAAFDERDYYGIDHHEVFMGMAVNPSFPLERLESVAVTNLPVEGGDPLYRVVSQVSDVGVVRPVDPSAVAELMTFRRGATGTVDDVRLVVPSSLSAGGAPLYSAAETQTLGMLLYALQDHFAANVYPDITPLRLDVEVEVRPDGTIILKQARPYLGTEP